MSDERTTYTVNNEDEAAAAEAAAAAYRTEARNAKFAPLRAIVGTDAFEQTIADLQDIVHSGTFADDALVNIHLTNAVTLMSNLRTAAA